MSDEDRELELLKEKRLREMQQNISQRKRVEEVKTDTTKPESSRETVLKQLGYRGEEVLLNAESQFPQESKLVIDKLAELIRGGEITEIIDGGKLLALFRSIGIRIRMQTTISVEQDGKMVSWSDKLKADSKIESKHVDSDNSGDFSQYQDTTPTTENVIDDSSNPK